MIHFLKLHPKDYGDVEIGNKRFDVRKNDRDYKVGDKIVFNEFPSSFISGTVRISEQFKITYILTHEDFPDGIMPGYCVFGMERV